MIKYTYIGSIKGKTYLIDVIKTKDSDKAYKRLKQLQDLHKFDEVIMVKEGC